MENYYSELADQMVQTQPLYNVDQELSIVNAAKEGSEEAQWLVWVTYNAFHKAGSKTGLFLKHTVHYVSNLLLECHKTGKKLETYFTWMKREKKFHADHNRMIFSYLHHIAIKVIRNVHNCSRDDAKRAYSEFAMKQTPLERSQGQEPLFDRINTISKLDKELKYYAKNYKRWSFLFESSRSLKFQPPGKYLDVYGVQGILEYIIPNIKVQS